MSDQDFILVDEEDTEKNIENRAENNVENSTRSSAEDSSGKDGGKEVSAEEKSRDEVIASDKKEDDKDEYEKICFICHRPESVTGKMIDLPNNITVCPDCMQKSFDAMTSGAVDLNRLMNTPGVQFLNMSDLENMQPRQQKIKKKKEKPKEYHQLDIRKIPAPHISKYMRIAVHDHRLFILFAPQDQGGAG